MKLHTNQASQKTTAHEEEGNEKVHRNMLYNTLVIDSAAVNYLLILVVLVDCFSS